MSPSYFYHGNLHTGKRAFLYWDGVLASLEAMAEGHTVYLDKPAEALVPCPDIMSSY